MNSMRKQFAESLLRRMSQNPDIYLLTGDLGFGMLDAIRDAFPDRYVNCGAAEQVMVGTAIGLALEKKVPFVYSITPFLLARPFEWLRNYVNYERIAVHLVGSGRDADYVHDGLTHHAHDAKNILALFPNIASYWPDDIQQIEPMLAKIITDTKPSFLSLRR